jgi:hypothetical protein
MWWLVACSEFGLDPTDPPPPDARVVVTDTFEQAPVAPVDLLFVVDDTASMGQEQHALAAAFAPLTERMLTSGVSWQIGVIAGTADGEGRLLGAPFVLTGSTPEVAEVFAERLHVGTSGRPPEAALYAATLALDDAATGGANAGFRRPDAALHVVFVSDDDDHSDTRLGTDPVAAFLLRLDEEAGPDRAVVVSAVAGDSPLGCTSANGAARPGTRYTKLVEATGGVFESICGSWFTGLAGRLLDASVEPGARFPLSEHPEAGSVRVEVDGVAASGTSVIVEQDVAWLVFAVPPPVGAHVEVTYVVLVSG